ncbi:MAG TPA: hypothetical protein VGF53_17295 [Pseudolabrys sp.]
MRILLAIALFACGLAGGVARAADIPAGDAARYFEQGQRSEMLEFYDDQPGVVVRGYWEAPWGYRHYFPTTGIRPRIGRYENLSAVSPPLKPARTFRRSWSNNWAFERILAADTQTFASQYNIQADIQSGTQSGTHHRPHPHGPHKIHKH